MVGFLVGRGDEEVVVVEVEVEEVLEEETRVEVVEVGREIEEVVEVEVEAGVAVGTDLTGAETAGVEATEFFLLPLLPDLLSNLANSLEKYVPISIVSSINIGS